MLSVCTGRNAMGSASDTQRGDTSSSSWWPWWPLQLLGISQRRQWESGNSLLLSRPVSSLSLVLSGAADQCHMAPGEVSIRSICFGPGVSSTRAISLSLASTPVTAVVSPRCCRCFCWWCCCRPKGSWVTDETRKCWLLPLLLLLMVVVVVVVVDSAAAAAAKLQASAESVTVVVQTERRKKCKRTRQNTAKSSDGRKHQLSLFPRLRSRLIFCTDLASYIKLLSMYWEKLAAVSKRKIAVHRSKPQYWGTNKKIM